jgi:hypothetical protein
MMKIIEPIKKYIAPSIEVIYLCVEQGFQQSLFEDEMIGKPGSLNYSFDNDYDI